MCLSRLFTGIMCKLNMAKGKYSKLDVHSEGGPRGHRVSVVGRSGWAKSEDLCPFNGNLEALQKYGVVLDTMSPTCKVRVEGMLSG